LAVILFMTTNTNNKTTTHLWIKDIIEETRINDYYLVKLKQLGTTRNGKPFISLRLADRTGEVEAKVWDRATELGALFKEGDIIYITGHASSYRNQIQITITNLKCPDKEMDQGLFMEATPSNTKKMLNDLEIIIRDVKNPHLKTLVESFLSDHDFMLLFERTPAAKNFHHSYLGGLLEHSLSVCRLAILVSDHYPQLDKDILITAAFLHDIGKVRELEIKTNINYTDEGRLLGHLVIGTQMLNDKIAKIKDFPPDLALRLKHIILSHHGQYEFGSPKKPKFLEAIAINLIDDLDAKINGLDRFMAQDRHEGSWTSFNRMFEQFFLKGEILEIE